MIYKLMTVEDLINLHNNLKKPIFVKFPKNSSQTFLFNNTQYCHKFKGIVLYNDYKSVETTVKELLVEMNYHTYDLHQLTDDTDYELALSVYEQYIGVTLPKEGLRFMYLLGLVIADYESKHYPIATTSTVELIDHLLEMRDQDWTTIRSCLGYGSSIDPLYIRQLFVDDQYKLNDLIVLSHLFCIPVCAFIVGGYNA